MSTTNQIEVTHNQTVTTTYTLPDLSEGPSEQRMAGNIEMIEAVLSSREEYAEYVDVNHSMQRMFWEIKNQLYLFEQYREVVEKTLIPTHNTLQNLNPIGRVVIHLLEKNDHDGLIADKLFRELNEIIEKREAAKEVSE
ncbi:hypothetical protein [Desulfopila sp. IMCC35008]|uniref:hypothetical protein n=1 Tax=Desulfopila sp. IMCC35008 TaxID=2653858 RepID=UPI0013D6860D|nr:hypothetical protein [Desulfopila sp. IMCC35008]